MTRRQAGFFSIAKIALFKKQVKIVLKSNVGKVCIVRIGSFTELLYFLFPTVVKEPVPFVYY